MQRPFYVSLIVLAGAASTLAILDATQELGQFHGLLLIMGTYYACATVALGSIILGIIQYARNHKTSAKHILSGGLLAAMFVAGLTYLVTILLQ